MKKIILSIIALLAVLAGSSLGVYYFVDINNYKTDIEALIKEQTGNDAMITGEMHLRLLPDIALDIKRISMPSPNGGRSEDAIYIKQLIVHLKILPLFKKKIEVDSVKIINPEVKYIIFEDGSNNFSKKIVSESLPVADKKNKKEAEVVPEAPEKNYAIERDFINSQLVDKFKLSRIVIQSGKFIFSDERKGVFVALVNVDIDTSLMPSKNPLKIVGTMKATPGINVPFEVLANYQVAKDKYEISDIQVTVGAIKAHGEVSADFLGILPDGKVTFYFEDMDMTPYAGLIDLITAPILSKDLDVDAETPTPKYPKINNKVTDIATWNDKPIDFMRLRNFNANLNFKSNKILYKNTNIGSITIYAYLINGKATFSVKEAEIFGGNINSETSIDVTSSVPKIKNKLNLEDVDLALLPVNLFVLNKFTGKINGGTMFTSHGLTSMEIVRNLNGALSLKAENGVIKDIDLVSMARNAPGAFDSEVEDASTPFKELSGDFDVTNGVMKADNMQLGSDILDFSGRGTVNVPEMSLNLTLTPKLKRTKEEKDILGGIKSQVLVSGDVLDPSFDVEIQNLVEDVIKNPKATENLVKQLKRDFKDIKNNMKSDSKGNKTGGFFDDVIKAFKGF